MNDKIISLICFVIIILLIIIILPIYISIFLILLLLLPFFYNHKINKNIKEIEVELLKKYNGVIKNIDGLNYYKIYGNNTNNALIPFDQMSSGHDGYNNPIILLHGTGSCSLFAWDKEFIDELKNISPAIYMIDLPYFGNNNSIKEKYDKNTITDIIFKFIKQLNNKPIIISHSFGSYIGLQLCIKHPEYIHKIVAISPVGIFKFLGKYGPYWGLFFKLGFPTIFYKQLYLFENIIIALSKLFNQDSYTQTLLLRIVSNSHFIVNKYVDVTPFGVEWNEPLINHLVNSKVPMALVFGELDTLTPPTIGKLLNNIIGIPYYVINNSYHNPINNIKNIKEIINNCKKPKYNNIHILDKHYTSSFNFFRESKYY